MAEYVERRNDGYYVAGTRVSLDSIVYAFQRGASPESIHRSFPLAGPLENIYGAITYYLAHQGEIDRDLADARAAEETAARQGTPLPDGLKAKLEQARFDALRR